MWRLEIYCNMPFVLRSVGRVRVWSFFSNTVNTGIILPFVDIGDVLQSPGAEVSAAVSADTAAARSNRPFVHIGDELHCPGAGIWAGVSAAPLARNNRPSTSPVSVAVVGAAYAPRAGGCVTA